MEPRRLTSQAAQGLAADYRNEWERTRLARLPAELRHMIYENSMLPQAAYLWTHLEKLPWPQMKLDFAWFIIQRTAKPVSIIIRDSSFTVEGREFHIADLLVGKNLVNFVVSAAPRMTIVIDTKVDPLQLRRDIRRDDRRSLPVKVLALVETLRRSDHPRQAIIIALGMRFGGKDGKGGLSNDRLRHIAIRILEPFMCLRAPVILRPVTTPNTADVNSFKALCDCDEWFKWFLRIFMKTVFRKGLNQTLPPSHRRLLRFHEAVDNLEVRLAMESICARGGRKRRELSTSYCPPYQMKTIWKLQSLWIDAFWDW